MENNIFVTSGFYTAFKLAKYAGEQLDEAAAKFLKSGDYKKYNQYVKKSAKAWKTGTVGSVLSAAGLAWTAGTFIYEQYTVEIANAIDWVDSQF